VVVESGSAKLQTNGLMPSIGLLMLPYQWQPIDVVVLIIIGGNEDVSIKLGVNLQHINAHLPMAGPPKVSFDAILEISKFLSRPFWPT
jgi:hypothetical protein